MAIIGILPVTLQNGTTADATQVMSDFNFIVNQVNANALPTSFVAPGTLLNVQTFTVSGTYTPFSGATKAWVRAIAGGGAGGATVPTGPGQCAAGGGGGAGAYGELYVSTGLATTTITIGLGGLANLAPAGGSGGNTSFGALLVCVGGTGGTQGGAGSGSAGGFNSGNGGTGGNCSGSGNIIVNGRGATGGTGVGFTTAYVQNGLGANSMWGSGGDPFNSGAARGFGSGGVGAGVGQNSAAAQGQNGAPGLMIIFEFA
jgi:hypothetical protein